MAEESRPKKTLDQIVDDTLSSNFGISDADLQLLFEDKKVEEPTPSPTPATATPTVEPVTPTPPVTEPTVPTADVVVPTHVVAQPEPPRPEVPTSDKSNDLENSLKETNNQIAQLSLIVQELLKKSQATGTELNRSQPDPLDEIDDQAIIQSPKENVVKTVRAVLQTALPAAFSEYDNIRNTRDFVNRFRSEHTDFDELRPLMRQIVAENPSVNDNPNALPRVYDEAKRRKTAALEAMKRELNIPITSVPPTVQAAPRLSEEEILSKLEQRLKEQIRKRRNASVPLTSNQTMPITPTNRMAPRDATVPMTEEEKMFDDMLKAGPVSANFLHGLDLASKK
jgi:hypothetical protein